MVPRSMSYARLRRGVPPLTAPPPHRPRLSHPCLLQRPRLDHRYPFILIKSESQIEESMAEGDPLCRGLMSRDHGPGPWDVDLFDRIFSRKIIQ
jgi:hypothetical protein